MRKEEQMAINRECLEAIERFNLARTTLVDAIVKPLRSCTAEVLIFDDYYVLRSYNTLVAFIDRETDTLYDVLRYVYGYTSTSAQHIAKFRNDYGQEKYGCKRELRWVSV